MYCLTKLECFSFFFSILNSIAMIELEYWLRANNIKKIANIQISSDRVLQSNTLALVKI